MSGLLRDLEEAFVEFVKERVPEDEWKHITSSGAVLSRLDEESENELKEHFWEELKCAIRWSNVVQGVQDLVESEPETEEETDTEEDEES
jgi:hypothetical protein